MNVRGYVQPGVHIYTGIKKKAAAGESAIDDGGGEGGSRWGENAKVEKERNKPIKAGSERGEGVM